MTNPEKQPPKKLLLRLPHALHEQVWELAAKQGVSTNELITLLVAGGVRFKLAQPKTRAQPKQPAEPPTHEEESREQHTD
jgi:hypothetical protein